MFLIFAKVILFGQCDNLNCTQLNLLLFFYILVHFELSHHAGGVQIWRL
jgi:hypothetical protein